MNYIYETGNSISWGKLNLHQIGVFAQRRSAI